MGALIILLMSMFNVNNSYKRTREILEEYDYHKNKNDDEVMHYDW